MLTVITTKSRLGLRPLGKCLGLDVITIALLT